MLEWIDSLDNSDWIAFLALVVAAIALVVTLVEQLSNKPKLRVVMSSAAVSPHEAGIKFTTTPRKFREDELSERGVELVAVDITNFGRQPTMIKTVEFYSPHSDSSVCPHPVRPANSTGSSLPSELTPGQFATFYFDGAVGVVADRGATPILLKDFVQLDSVVIQVRHSWNRKPQKFYGINKK